MLDGIAMGVKAFVSYGQLTIGIVDHFNDVRIVLDWTVLFMRLIKLAKIISNNHNLGGHFFFAGDIKTTHCINITMAATAKKQSFWYDRVCDRVG